MSTHRRTRDRPGDGALAALVPGPTLSISCGDLSVAVAPEAGGRLLQINFAGVDWLLPYAPGNAAMIAWGCYPMIPWAGRIRDAQFVFQGAPYQLPPNLGRHAIHGLGFGLPWRIESHSESEIELSVQLPQDQRWPFAGRASQTIEVTSGRLQMQISVTAGRLPMPCVIGWHPWLLAPADLEFAPSQVYPRDDAGIATLPLGRPTAPPWDDCFVNHQPVKLARGGQRLRLSSNCDHWVVYNELAHTVAIEPQSGPPNAFNLSPNCLAPGNTITRWFAWEWS